jgi:hypothetical protein
VVIDNPVRRMGFAERGEGRTLHVEGIAQSPTSPPPAKREKIESP